MFESSNIVAIQLSEERCYPCIVQNFQSNFMFQVSSTEKVAYINFLFQSISKQKITVPLFQGGVAEVFFLFFFL